MKFEKELILDNLELRQLATRGGFYDLWNKSIKYFKTYEDAYEALEDIHEAQYFERKWSSYESYRMCYNRSLKKPKIKKR